MTRSTLEELLARCEAATGMDRELDRDIMVAAFGVGVKNSLPLPGYTSSIDAIVGLIEANFPIAEGSWNLVIYGAYHRASLMPCDPQSHGMHDKRSGLSEHCSSIALACCSAFLRAKLSSGGDE